MEMKNPLYETPTYMGSLDDMGYLYSGNNVKHRKISSVLCEHLLMSGPMLINDGYLVQQPEFIDLCISQPHYIEAAIERKGIKILSRGSSLTEVIEEAEKSGVIGHQLYGDGEYKKHIKQIEKLEKLFVKHDSYVSFPQKDLTVGYLNLLKEAAENIESEQYSYDNKDILAPIVEKTIRRIESRGKAARTQHEIVSCEFFDHEFREKKSLNDRRMQISMRFANEVYHHNLSLLIADDINSPIFCDTNRSGAFDGFLDQAYKTNSVLKKHHIPFVKAEWLEKRADQLAGLFDDDNCLYSIKKDYLKELFQYMNDSKNDDTELIKIKNIYQHALATKLGFDKQLAYHLNRMSLGLAIPIGITSALIGATVAPQIGYSMLIATIFLTGAGFAIDKAANPWITNKSLNVFFKNSIDVNRINKKRIAQTTGYSNLPISQKMAVKFSNQVPNFS